MSMSITARQWMKFFDVHNGADVILVRNLAMKRFKVDEATYNYWLGVWRFERKQAK